MNKIWSIILSGLATVHAKVLVFIVIKSFYQLGCNFAEPIIFNTFSQSKISSTTLSVSGKGLIKL